MRFELEHFRTKLGGRIVKLFFLCALLPTATLSVVSYLYFRSQVLSQSTELMDLGATDAQMGALERLQSVESELILLGASPSGGTRAQRRGRWHEPDGVAAAARCPDPDHL